MQPNKVLLSEDGAGGASRNSCDLQLTASEEVKSPILQLLETETADDLNEPRSVRPDNRLAWHSPSLWLRHQAEKQKKPPRFLMCGTNCKLISGVFVFFFNFVFYVHKCVACMYICPSNASYMQCLQGQKRASESLEPELQMVDSYHLGTGDRTWFLTKNPSVLNSGIISPAPSRFVVVACLFYPRPVSVEKQYSIRTG